MKTVPLFLPALLGCVPLSYGAGKAQTFISPDQVPEGLAKSDWSSIRAAYEAGRHVFQPIEGGWQARNPGQQWTTTFDRRGFFAQPRGAGWRWGLELKAYGFPGAERAIAGVPAVTAGGQRLNYQWDEAVQEWFVNDQRGLEHGFTVAQRPARSDASELSITMAVRGTLTPHLTSDALGVEFRDAAGATILTYGGLKAWDADGKGLACGFVAVAEGVRLLVNECGARYPITIDPIAQQAYLKAGQVTADDRFGTSVAISGNTVVVGAGGESGSSAGVNGTVDELAPSAGAAYVFVRNGTTWSQQAYLKASQVTTGDNFGYSVAISGDTVVVGAFGEDGSSMGVNGGVDELAPDAGAAYVFVRSGTTWSQQAYVKASQVTAGDFFGYSVAVSGDTVVVGADSEDSDAAGINATANEGANGAGAAYIFVRSGTTWSQQAYLKARQVTEADSFGHSVAIFGDTVVVGAPFEDGSATGVNGAVDELASSAGAAYVFVRSGTTWSQQAYLKASQVSASDNFGISVAVSGDTAVVGARGEDSASAGINPPANEGAEDAGAAYVFVRNGTTWSQQAYLKASQVSAVDGFGFSVAISGDTVVVGAVGEDGSLTGVNSAVNESGDSVGAAFVFVRNGTTWSQQAYLKADQVTLLDDFGYSVAVSGDTVVVGSPYEDGSAAGVNGTVDDSAESAGAAYVFSGVGNRGVGSALKVPVGVLNGVHPGGAEFVPNTGFQPAFVPGAWTAGAGPEKAVDQNTHTAYANAGGAQSGLVFFNFGAGGGFDQITFYTRGNFLDAEPVSFALYGRVSPAADGYLNGVPQAYMLASSPLLTTGTISLPATGAGITTVHVPAFPQFTTYILIFTDLRGPSKATMEIAEIAFERTAPRWGTPAITRSGNNSTLKATGLASQTYTLYRNTGLTPTGWLPLGDTTAQAGGLIQFNPGSADPKAFFRIEEKGVSLAR